MDELLAQEQIDPSGQFTNIYWPLGDHLNTIRDIAADDGNGGSVVANHRQFDSFGSFLVRQNFPALESL